MYSMVAPVRYRSLSFWHDTVPGTLTPGEPLPGDTEADVVIVGAGFTGLWTAYYLARTAPDLRVVVCEREIAGFGASGRNGGWCSALFPASLNKLERMAGQEAADLPADRASSVRISLSRPPPAVVTCSIGDLLVLR